VAKRADFVESRRSKRRKQIFEGAVKVFAKKGYHSATTQEIADAAGLAKGTLYEYVRDKEEILLIVVEEGMLMVKSEIGKAISGIDDPEERMKRAIFVQLKFAKKYRNAAKVMQHEIRNLSVDGKKRLSELMNGQIELLRSILDDGIKAGRFRKLDSRIAAELFHHTSTFYFGYGDLPYQKASLDDITKFIMDNLIHAIIKEKTKEPTPVL